MIKSEINLEPSLEDNAKDVIIQKIVKPSFVKCKTKLSGYHTNLAFAMDLPFYLKKFL